jgi:hypothetical protein
MQSVPRAGEYLVAVDGVVQKPEDGEIWTVGDGELDAQIAGLSGETSKLTVIIAGLVCGVVGGGAIAAGVLFALRCKPQRAGAERVEDDSLDASGPGRKFPSILT